MQEYYLTPRENDIVLLLRTGKPNKIIGHELGLTENTVRQYLYKLYKKVGVSNRTELALRGNLRPPVDELSSGEESGEGL